MSTVRIAECATLGEAYRIVQSLPAGSEVLELIPSAGPAVVILKGGTAGREVPFTNAIERAWLGLENPPLARRLVIFESRSIADVFAAAAKLEAAGLMPFDLRILRGAEPTAYVLATGDAPAGGATQGLSGTLTEIADPAPALREFFEIKSE